MNSPEVKRKSSFWDYCKRSYKVFSKDKKEVYHSDCYICLGSDVDVTTELPIKLKCKHHIHFACLEHQTLRLSDKGPIILRWGQCGICGLWLHCKKKKFHNAHLVKEMRKFTLNNENNGNNDNNQLFRCFDCASLFQEAKTPCEEQGDFFDNDKKAIQCSRCRDKCREHGEEYLVYKCNYCCAEAIFHCSHGVYYCDDCHNEYPNNIAKECNCDLRHVANGTLEKSPFGCGLCGVIIADSKM